MLKSAQTTLSRLLLEDFLFKKGKNRSYKKLINKSITRVGIMKTKFSIYSQ